MFFKFNLLKQQPPGIHTPPVTRMKFNTWNGWSLNYSKTTVPPPCQEKKTFFFRFNPATPRYRFDKICVHVLKLDSGSVDCKLWLVYVCTSASPFEKNQKQTWDIYRYMGLGSLAWKLEKKYPTLFGKPKANLRYI